MKKSTFKVLFLIRRNQVNKDGKCAIIIKITVDSEYERLNSTLSIEPDLWDAAASKAIGRSSKIAEFNKRIEDMRHVLKEHYYDLLNRHGYVTAEMVKNAFTGVTAKVESLVTLYLQHLEDTKKLIGISKRKTALPLVALSLIIRHNLIIQFFGLHSLLVWKIICNFASFPKVK